MLLKFNAKYHNQFQDNIYGSISTITVNGVSSQAKQNLTGDYFRFGVTIIPHKNVFR